MESRVSGESSAVDLEVHARSIHLNVEFDGFAFQSLP
jgi:hypothetical protein